jgi:hypothetical protein
MNLETSLFQTQVLLLSIAKMLLKTSIILAACLSLAFAASVGSVAGKFGQFSL